ncbi:MAG: hypothetical protein ACKO5K_03775 [Armatimonadota bacterium]
MLSGWCYTCGARRGVDGRCPQCDPWWTSPLLVTGIPVVAVFGLLLALTVARFSPKGAGGPPPTLRAPTWTPVPGAPMAAPATGAPAAAAGANAPASERPTVATPPPLLIPPSTDGIEDPQAEARAVVELEALRETVHEVEALTRRRGTEVAAPIGEGPRAAETGS